MKRATTSASNIARRKACPGSAAMEAPFAETDSEYSAEGTMLHKLFLTGQRPETLTSEQAQTLDAADFYAGEFFTHVRETFGIPDDARFFDEREIPLMLHDPDGQPELFPGHADAIRTFQDFNVRAIVDAKFGYLDVEAAPENHQLSSYACMRQQMSAARAIAVSIVAPRNFGPRLTMAVYDADGLKAATNELCEIYASTLQRNAPLNAGDHCHHCRAKTACKAYKAKFDVLLTKPETTTAIDTLPSYDLERLHVAIQFANKIKDEVSGEMRRRVTAGEMPGWKLQNSGDDVTLNDALGFFIDLQGVIDLTASEFDSTRKLIWSSLEAIVQHKRNVSEKRAKEIIRDVSAPYVTRTPKQPRVVRDKTKSIES